MAALHEEVLRVGVVSNFGCDFLKRMYVQMIASPQHHVFVAETDGQATGYVIWRFSAFSPLKIIRLRDMLHFLARACAQPYLLFNALRLFIGFKALKPPPGEHWAEVAHWGVNPYAQGLGIGTALLDRAIETARSHSATHIVTYTHKQQLLNYYRRRFNAAILSTFPLLGVTYHGVVWRIT